MGRCGSPLSAVSDSSPICSFLLSNSMNPSSIVTELSKPLPNLFFKLKPLSVLINMLVHTMKFDTNRRAYEISGAYFILSA